MVSYNLKLPIIVCKIHIRRPISDKNGTSKKFSFFPLKCPTVQNFPLTISRGITSDMTRTYPAGG